VDDARWLVVGVGDFGGDAKGDLLLQHQNGDLLVWHLDGVSQTRTESITPRNAGDAGWRVKATADFDGDGKQDILFQHTSGDLSIWFMNGTVLKVGGAVLTSPSNPGSGWSAVAAADVNNNGRVDIIFQHSDGSLAVWYMNAQLRIDFDALNPANAGPGLRVAAAADYGQSSQTDLILQNALTGDVQVWYMFGTHAQIRRLLNPSNAGLEWSVVGPK
jgi:FG-GAP-like repeat